MFLSVVHLRELRCSLCAALLAAPGSRSFIVDERGDPVKFPAENPPQEMTLELICENGHVTQIDIPADASAEESLMTPDEAPLATDAIYRSNE